jgi:hypothetical protein
MVTLVCDLHPHCQSQGCTADPTKCQRVTDLRGGVDKRPDLTRHDAAAYKITLKNFTDDQLFEAWSSEYDAKHVERIKLIIAEMDARNTVGVIKL